MIDTFAEKIAVFIKDTNHEETTSIEIMKFSLIIILNTCITIIISLIVGYLTGELLNTIIAMFSFAFLRLFSGGLHLSSAVGCIILSSVIIISIPHLPMHSQWSFILTLISGILVIFFAPSNIKNVTRIKKENYRVFKFFSILVVSSNFIVNSPIISIAFLVQSITLIPIKGGEKS